MIKEVVIGSIGTFCGETMFITKTRAVEIKYGTEVTLGDSVVGYIKKTNVSKRFDPVKTFKNEFVLLASTEKRHIAKYKMASVVMKFVNNNKQIIEAIKSKWIPLNYKSMFSKRKNYNLVYARHIYMFICRLMTDKTYHQIAKECNINDATNHTSVIHGVKRISNELSTNIAFASALQSLIDECKK